MFASSDILPEEGCYGFRRRFKQPQSPSMLYHNQGIADKAATAERPECGYSSSGAGLGEWVQAHRMVGN